MQGGGAPAASLPQHSRLARDLGKRLREVRKQRALTGPEVAAIVGVNQSTVSRVETGDRVPTEAYVRAFAAGLRLSAREREALLQAARSASTEATSWRLLHRAGIARYQEEFAAEEAAAGFIRIFHTVLIPGLIQTPEYARSVLRKFGTSEEDGEVRAAVSGRLRRQTILYDGRKRFGFTFLEAALRLGLAPKGVMAAQADRLAVLSSLPNIDVGVVPMDAELPSLPYNGFIVFDDASLVLELSTGELTFREPAEVKRHVELYEAMSSVAMKGDSLQAWLSEFARSAAVTAGA